MDLHPDQQHWPKIDHKSITQKSHNALKSRAESFHGCDAIGLVITFTGTGTD